MGAPLNAHGLRTGRCRPQRGAETPRVTSRHRSALRARDIAGHTGPADPETGAEPLNHGEVTGRLRDDACRAVAGALVVTSTTRDVAGHGVRGDDRGQGADVVSSSPARPERMAGGKPAAAHCMSDIRRPRRAGWAKTCDLCHIDPSRAAAPLWVSLRVSPSARLSAPASRQEPSSPPTTPPATCRCSRDSRRCASAPECTSGPPTRAG